VPLGPNSRARRHCHRIIEAVRRPAGDGTPQHQRIDGDQRQLANHYWSEAALENKGFSETRAGVESPQSAHGGFSWGIGRCLLRAGEK
jgi:hypothetical protein